MKHDVEKLPGSLYGGLPALMNNAKTISVLPIAVIISPSTQQGYDYKQICYL